MFGSEFEQVQQGGKMAKSNATSSPSEFRLETMNHSHLFLDRVLRRRRLLVLVDVALRPAFPQTTERLAQRLLQRLPTRHRVVVSVGDVWGKLFFNSLSFPNWHCF